MVDLVQSNFSVLILLCLLQSLAKKTARPIIALGHSIRLGLGPLKDTRLLVGLHKVGLASSIIWSVHFDVKSCDCSKLGCGAKNRVSTLYPSSA